MNISEFDYHLPEELIAQEPLTDRASSRMLVLNKSTGEVSHRTFRDLPSYLFPGDLLVLNDTQVSALRLHGHRPTGGAVEALLLKEVSEDVYQSVVRPAKRLKPGTKLVFEGGLEAIVIENDGEMTRILKFPPGSRKAIQTVGQVPLPPYIRQKLSERARYQTVYAHSPGSAAAPTAGLHFTPEVLDQLQAKGIDRAFVTLNVGLDTFRPIAVGDTSDHVMHGEACSVPPDTAEKARSCQGRVVAVGTTSVRTLESLATGKRQIDSATMDTRLFIEPGYSFQIVDAMLTNFHMPRTTMLLMLAALAGVDTLRNAYAEAVKHKYRFLSFGDCMLII